MSRMRLRATALVTRPLVACVVLLAACASPSKPSALQGYGPVTVGRIGINPKVLRLGHTYGFAFPLLRNASRSPLTITSVSLGSVPSGVHVVRYTAMSVNETQGQLMAAYIGENDKNDYLYFPTHPISGISIAPGAESPYYPVVLVKLVGRVSADLSGCLVNYRQDGRSLHQTLHCVFTLQ
jgi:hypothetical protein